MPHTITVHYALGILQAAQRLGLPVPAELQADSLAPRIPLQRQDAFWETICAASGDPLLGLRLGSALQVGHLDMVGALLMSCDHYGEALDALLEYYPIIAEGSEFQREQDAAQVRLVYRPSYAVRREERVEAALASLVHLTRWITGDRVKPQRLTLNHAPRGELARYVEVLECPVSFDSAENALYFAVADLDVPLIQANALMREHLRALADAQLQRLGAQSLAVRVQQLLKQNPRWGKEKVAEQLDLSGRHLNRKLADEGASFKLLRDQVLYGMAEQLLRESLRLGEVAERLGFSDESAFAKAFRRWSGMTPGQFRQGS
ncbi:MAG: AraC family transcriptional regulator [Pseudomonas sp.]|uniref:AraC-like transcriptional regulator QhpR n=1 Tax=Pseudomonas sp. TaxID=306 RepID=UPI000CC07206|nr:AraC family transcriptional regulator [Pseudomonas sp.]PJI47912.1 MAG: AraC family transcriptional regulator [Pseudomonas sp.]